MFHVKHLAAVVGAASRSRANVVPARPADAEQRVGMLAITRVQCSDVARA
jgi:hypothetical protein